MTTTRKFDLILRGGHVIDPAQGSDGAFDVGIRGGKIAAVSKSLKGERCDADSPLPPIAAAA